MMDDRFNGNRIFFGQYNGETPVTGHRTHPRLTDKDEQARNKRRHKRLKAEYKSIAEDQRQARQFDQANAADGPTRYIFKSVDGAEMVSRWDMQSHPPDILVTNPSMLGAMLSREVEDPIFDKTRHWLETTEDAAFFVVFDELHLLRGSSGTETSFLIKALLTRLGLDDPAHRHKLRILASSASLPLDAEKELKSLTYLRDLLAPFGTFRHPGDHGSTSPEFWRSAIVEGKPVLPPSNSSEYLDPAPFEALIAKAERGRAFAASLDGLDVNQEIAAIADALHLDSWQPPDLIMAAIAEAAADRITSACIDKDSLKPRATAAGAVSETLFGRNSIAAVRGIMLARALPEAKAGSGPVKAGTPSFRLHTFIRNIEGLFGSFEKDEGDRVSIGDITIERGLSHGRASNGQRGKRLFELLYCEACGDLFAGGQRGRSSASAQFELLPSNPDLDRIPDAEASVTYDNMTFDEFAVFWPSRAAPKQMEQDYDRWEDATLDPTSGLVSVGGQSGPGIVEGRVYFQTDNAVQGHAPKTAQPFCCPNCGTDYSRRPRHLRLSPIRGFRTGFTKASQLVATELFELLHAARDEAKTIVFSDSRQDAAKQALEVERLHKRDLNREILVGVARQYLRELEARYVAPSDRNAVLLDILNRGDDNASQEVQRLTAEWNQKGIDVVNRKIQFESLLKLDAGDGRISRLIAELVRLGIHPSDEAGRRKLAKRPWFECFDVSDGDVTFSRGLSGQERDEANSDLNRHQYSLIIDAVFANSFFALEETGLAYASVQRGSGPNVDELDAWLRVFAAAYRIQEGQYFDEDTKPWVHGSNVPQKNRVRRYAEALYGTGWEAGLTRILEEFRKLFHANGVISVGKLFIRISEDDDPYWRCTSCERVHLHKGTSRCTRCHDKLLDAPTGIAKDLWGANFLGKRIVRSSTEAVPRFRLTCEELTGQTDDFSDRLRRYKGIFVDDISPIERAARDIDMLSVTTTMEVGIDIGSLNSVYQANMPPQRFNYQQRVGRAGRRGQAFSFVTTFCRGRTHDEHYFRNPRAITGDAPPPPFLAVDHRPIPERLARKVWLRAAFADLRDGCQGVGQPYPGDVINPPDIHGEYIGTGDFYAPGSPWPERLKGALERTSGERDRFLQAAVITGAGGTGDARAIRSTMEPGKLVDAIFDLGRGGDVPDKGLGHFLAEAGLLPMYGMPTNVRNLYTGVEREHGAQYGAPDEFVWAMMDRDLDVAISEYAPGKVLVKDKQKHLVVGFTGALMDPSRRGPKINLPQPLTAWFSDERKIGRCGQCGATKEQTLDDTTAAVCDDCSASIEDHTFRRFVSPAGFRTDFQTDNAEERFSKHSTTTVATVLHLGQIQSFANIRLHHGAGVTILRLNEGQEDENGDPLGFTVSEMDDEGVWIAGKQNRLESQGIVEEFVNTKASRWLRTGIRHDGIGLLSRKQTDAIYIEGISVHPDLALDLVARRGPHSHLAARAAAVSATHLIVQQAALELDVAPEEFEALEPRRRDGKPMLQIADALVNGSGLCRALSSVPPQGKPKIIELIERITCDPTTAPLDYMVGADHVQKCQTSCYKCIQQYGNRRYHGILDWRLAIAYLRSLIHPGFTCGIDNTFGEWELRDWKDQAMAIASDLVAMRPSSLSLAKNVGPYGLPLVSDSGNGTKTLVIHPLWKVDATAQARLFGSDNSSHRFANTFELARRPLKALEKAQAT